MVWKTRLAFGSPDLALTLLFATINGWLLYYLVTILELPALLAGAAFVFGRVLDGILDPIIGNWTDRHRRKPMIAWALPFAAAGFVALWVVPALVAMPVSATMATALTFAIFAVAYTGVSVSRLAMMPAVVPDYDGRTGQASTDMGFVFVGVLIASTAFPGAVAALGGGALADSAPTVWIMVACCIAGLAMIAYLPFLIFIREPPRPPVQTARPGLWKTIAALRHTAGAVPTLLLFMGTVLTMVTLQSILPFWLERGPGLAAGGQSLVLLTVFLTTIGSLPLWAGLARRLCKLRCLMAGIAVFLAGLALAIALPAGGGGTPALYLAAGLAGAGAGALSMCPWAMIPDVAEAHARRLGAPVEGTATAAFTMTNKLSAAIALFLNALSLSVIDGSGPLETAPWALFLLSAAFAIATLAGAVIVLLMGFQPYRRSGGRCSALWEPHRNR